METSNRQIKLAKVYIYLVLTCMALVYACKAGNNKEPTDIATTEEHTEQG